MKIIVGLTGGIASGKSYVSDYLKNLGFKIVDTDNICRNLYFNEDFLSVLKKIFPTVFINNKLDKKALKDLVFSNRSDMEKLNNLIDPYILSETKKEIEEGEGIIFIDAPLLFEKKFDTLCNLVVCVYTDNNTQIERLMARDLISRDYAEKIINSQMDVNLKKSKSNILIQSCLDYNDTNSNILKALERIKDYGKNIRN